MCELVGRWARSETAVVRYVETQGASCGVLVQSAVRFIQVRSPAESLQQKVCAGDDSWVAGLPAAKPDANEPDANESHDR
jgi:fructose-1-phosphate kinase PfkB-like protein